MGIKSSHLELHSFWVNGQVIIILSFWFKIVKLDNLFNNF